MYPFLTFNKKNIQFPRVQQQPNGNDCGVFAIAFAVSLLFGLKPNTIRYEHSLMRNHLLRIFETNIIEHFPQDCTCGISKNVPHLSVVERRRVDALRKRIQRKNETQEQHQLRVEKQKTYNKLKKNKITLVENKCDKNVISVNDTVWEKNNSITFSVKDITSEEDKYIKNILLKNDTMSVKDITLEKYGCRNKSLSAKDIVSVKDITFKNCTCEKKCLSAKDIVSVKDITFENCTCENKRLSAKDIVSIKDITF